MKVMEGLELFERRLHMRQRESRQDRDRSNDSRMSNDSHRSDSRYFDPLRMDPCLDMVVKSHSKLQKSLILGRK